MSLKFEQLDPLMKSEFGLGLENRQDNDNDLDILDEFLDKRLYEDQNSGNHQTLQHDPTAGANNATTARDEEMFNNFLTDEINKNDFILFSPDANEASANTSMEMDFNQINDVLNQQLPGLNATTPISIDGDSPGSKSEIFHTPNSINANDPSYENARNILQNLKFGTEAPTQYSSEFPKEYLDIDADSLPYKLILHNLPSYSRVETQIKLDFTVSPPPPQFLVQLPNDTIAKQKFCLSSPLNEDVKTNILSLETFVLTATTMKPCNTCPRCVRREQKRASRRKSGVSDNLNWTTNTNKRAIIFNCKEIISFPPTSSIENSKSIDISARIVCYCRHHSENKGFKLLFVLKNSSNEVVAKHLSTPIMIMDRKKTGDESSNQTAVSDTNMGTATATPSAAPTTKSQPLSPTSIEEDSSEPHTTDSRVFKRKKTWSPVLSDGFSITPQRKISSGISLPNTSISMTPSRSVNDSTPIIQRIIPAQGPLRGGIEVTLLGSNFKQGLNVKFGMNRALSTQYWNDSTMVTYLPPAAQPGQVIVTVDDPEQPSTDGENKGSSIFTYLDDTDRQMIELALQIVGLKMNGKLEDARNIARKIIGSESSNDSSLNSTPNNFNNNSIEHFAIGVTDEDLILKVIAMLPANPNLAIHNTESQTLLHLSCLKGYYKLVSSLLHKGARVDVRDTNGYTPLHYACLAGHRTCIELLLKYRASVSIRNHNGESAEDVANINVLDLFKHDELDSINMQRKFSNSSISSSIFSTDDITPGMHISRMTTDSLYSSDIEDIDDEYSEDEEDIDASDEESDNDAEYERSLLGEPPIVGSSSTFDQIHPTAANEEDDDLTRPTDKSIWRKVRKVFNEDLPRYDELFPNRSWKIASFTNSSTSAETTEDTPTEETSDSEDIFQKFFHQRKNIQNDKMLLFVWLPLLILIVGSFILMNAGWKFEFKDNVKEFIRKTLGTIMLGNERFKVVLNKHLSQVNDAVTSVINVA